MFPIAAQQSAKSMKEQNEPKLYAFTAFQFSLFTIIFILPKMDGAALSSITTAIVGAVALGGVTIASTVFTDVLPTSWKNWLTHLSKPPAADQAQKVAASYLSGADAQCVDDFFKMPEHQGMTQRDIFDRLREFTETNTASHQAYKKYLLVREYTIIQFFLTATLLPFGIFAFSENIYHLQYSIYMIALIALLIISTWSTDLRFTQIVIKRSSFIGVDIKKAIQAGRIRAITGEAKS